ncbi:MAG TPA: DUF763 domain-containing protein [Rhizomicrobium sp.]|nr:DUF763 domain-containing protein [Rhizomicrobium sp.]
MKRSGHADLPLHGGRVPAWLAERMQTLGTALVEAIVYHYGAAAFLSRLSDPFWFQALGAVMGMDWHSSGITTSVMGALKRGLNPRAHELGIYVCGGRGRASKQTPTELIAIADKQGWDGAALVRTSRLTARVDNNAIGDGFQIYLHSFVLTTAGDWAVVQQGLNDNTGMARRYHWHSASVSDFVCEPHTGIAGENEGTILNLVDRRAGPAQSAILEVSATNPDKTLRELRELILPTHHHVSARDVDLKRLGAVLAVSHERQLRDFASLLLLENVGPRTLQTLALLAEVVHGQPARFSDPARFSFALGGKDGHPFPVPLKTYDESLGILRRALASAKTGESEKLEGFRRLDKLVRAVEQRQQPVANFERVLAHERQISASLDGRSVVPKRRVQQLRLF